MENRYIGVCKALHTDPNITVTLHQAEEVIPKPPSIPVAKAFADIDWEVASPAAWRERAGWRSNQQNHSSAARVRRPPVVSPPMLSPPPHPAVMPLVSIQSVSAEAFIRVDSHGELRADAEFPWSDDSWFAVLPHLCSQQYSSASRPTLADEDWADEANVLKRQLSSVWFALRSQRLGR